MKKILNLIMAGVLLFSNCNFLFAVDMSPEDFLTVWDTLPNNVYYSGGNYVECDINKPVRGCVNGAKSQITGSFENPGDVEVRKLVVPTNNLGEFGINLLVRGKNFSVLDSSSKICSVVVFDNSSSMMSGLHYNPDDPGEKWISAVSGAMEFSDYIINNIENSKLGLVFFSNLAYIEEEQGLSHTGFKLDYFDKAGRKSQGVTNIHDGLIKAGSMFSSSECDKKFLVLMSDGSANSRMDEDDEGNLFATGSIIDAPGKTVEYASGLKEQGIEIFSIGYGMEKLSNPENAKNTLKQIATRPEKPYYNDATEDNIEEIYHKIGENHIFKEAGRIISITDSLGENFIGDDINITEQSNITESGMIYSIPVRINPNASLWNNSNNGLILNYLDADGNPDVLEIPATMSSQIYWEQPKCDLDEPAGDGVLTGKGEFSQVWNTGVTDLGCSGLCPKSKSWGYTGSSSPGECEWTCMSGYKLNQNGDGCEEIISKKTVTIIVSPHESYGTVSTGSVSVDYGMNVTTSGNQIKIGDNWVTATPSNSTAQYTYLFSGWNNTCGDEVTDNCSVTAEFRRDVKQYEITFKNYDGTVLQSSPVTYGEMPVYTGTEPTRPYEGITIYRFEGWNPELTGVTQAQVYTANYRSSLVTHTVSICVDPNYYGTVNGNSFGCSSFSSLFHHGSSIVVDNGNRTVKIGEHTFTAAPNPGDVQYIYEFSGWNNTCGDILTYDCSITAEFRRDVKQYEITFKNYDGTVLQSSPVTYGEMPVYTGTEPTRPDEGTTTYTFVGWSPELTGVTQAQVYTANYSSSTGNNTGGGTSSGGGGGGGKLKKDNCPDGDFSGDFYDKKCGSKIDTGKTDVKTEEKPAVVTPVVNEKPAKKCSVEGSKHSKEVNDAYIWACENGIIKSNTIQGAKLGEYLNRAEMAKIVTVFEMLVLDSKPNRTKDCSAFANSISGYNAEMKNYMVTSCQLERMGIHTADHKAIKDFMPKKFVSRAEFGTILSRILWGNKYEASKNTSKYYVEHLTSLKGGGVLTNVNPELKERRSYAILMVYRAAKLLGKA